MFSGIIEATTTVSSVTPQPSGIRLEVIRPEGFDGVKVGDSVAINGCCLTVALLSSELFAFDVIHETLRLTTLGDLQAGAIVNCERSLVAGSRIDGHLVQGHIDGVATLVERAEAGKGSYVLRFALSPALARFIVKKGSIALDGISLTVADVDNASVTVCIIPHTAIVTTMCGKKVGDTSNVEVDVIAKYIERLATPYVGKGGGLLQENEVLAWN